MTYEVTKSEDEWRAELSPQEYRVLRQAGTEAAFIGEYTDTETVGVYKCRACGNELFRSDTKFHSHCGWPSFFDPADSKAVEVLEDRSFGMLRTEVRCARCGSHLGHIFEGEGYPTPTDQRYCINSISLVLEPTEEYQGARVGVRGRGPIPSSWTLRRTPTTKGSLGKLADRLDERRPAQQALRAAPVSDRRARRARHGRRGRPAGRCSPRYRPGW